MPLTVPTFCAQMVYHLPRCSKDGHVEGEVGKGIGVSLGCLHHARFHPTVLHRVVALADECVGADLPDAGQFAGGKVDDPLCP